MLRGRPPVTVNSLGNPCSQSRENRIAKYSNDYYINNSFTAANKARS